MFNTRYHGLEIGDEKYRSSKSSSDFAICLHGNSVACKHRHSESINKIINMTYKVLQQPLPHTY